MNLPSISIKHPVFAFMLSLLIVLFGWVSYERLGVDRYPDVEFPMISVTTTLPGANPDIIDASITSQIETAVNAVPGIQHVQSISSPSVSVVIITFDLSKDSDVAFNEVQSKINTMLRNLPKDTDPPIVQKMQFGAIPVMWLALQGDRTEQQLNQYARKVLKKQLETIDGVGAVTIAGKRDRTIRINIDLDKLNAHKISVQELVAAFSREHIQMPGGYVTSDHSELMLDLDMEFHHLSDLKNLIIADRNGRSIYLQDFAEVVDGLSDERKFAAYQGQPAVALGLVKVTGANAVSIVNTVKEKLNNNIIPELPPGIELSIASNDADLINEIVAALEEHLLLGTLLTAIIVLLFLKSLRVTGIITLSVPVSLLGAVAVMFFAGYTFNTMTLLALLLLIGVVVDDAIVVIENIYRHREENDAISAEDAAEKGTHEVMFAIIASTMTLVSIFLPVVFLEGIIGRFFQSFAVVVTVGVLISLFVAITLTPMLSSRFLTVTKKHGKLYQFFDKPFQWIDAAYKFLLTGAIRFKWLVVVLTLVVVYPSGYFFSHIGGGFLPEEDEGRFLISFKTPLGSSLSTTRDALSDIEAILKQRQDVDNYFSTIADGSAGQVNQGSIFVRLTPQNTGRPSMSQIIAQLRKDLAELPGVQAFPTRVPSMGGARGEPLQFVMRGQDLNQVSQLANQLKAKLAEHEAQLGKVDLDLQLDLPELRVRVDRTRAHQVGLSTQEIALAINVLAGGVNVAKYNDEPGDGERYDIRIQAGTGQIKTAEDLHKIYLKTPKGNLVRLDSVANLTQVLAPAVKTRYDLEYSAQFFSSPTIPIGEAVKIVNQAAEPIMKPGYNLKMIGQAEEFAKTAVYMLFAFGSAIVLVYMVLASQFNSFTQPLIVMVAQPLAIIGGVAGLWLMDMSLNIFSMIGLVLLMGLVAKNSILLVDLTNQYRAKGMSIDEALATACPIRLRPVLMTSLTIILTMLPAAMGFGAGADTNGPLAVAVIGGMITSTLLTLVVVPSVYGLAERGFEKWRNRKHLRFNKPATPQKTPIN